MIIFYCFQFKLRHNVNTLLWHPMILLLYHIWIILINNLFYHHRFIFDIMYHLHLIMLLLIFYRLLIVLLRIWLNLKLRTVMIKVFKVCHEGVFPHKQIEVIRALILIFYCISIVNLSLFRFLSPQRNSLCCRWHPSRKYSISCKIIIIFVTNISCCILEGFNSTNLHLINGEINKIQIKINFLGNVLDVFAIEF